MNNMNLSPDQMDALYKLAGQKLGKSADDLKSQLEGGNLGQALGNLDPKTQSKINEFASNPKAVEALLQNNSVKNLISGLMGGQK